jgi:hypothetical protein
MVYDHFSVSRQRESSSTACRMKCAYFPISTSTHLGNVDRTHLDPAHASLVLDLGDAFCGLLEPLAVELRGELVVVEAVEVEQPAFEVPLRVVSVARSAGMQVREGRTG